MGRFARLKGSQKLALQAAGVTALVAVAYLLFIRGGGVGELGTIVADGTDEPIKGLEAHGSERRGAAPGQLRGARASLPAAVAGSTGIGVTGPPSPRLAPPDGGTAGAPSPTDQQYGSTVDDLQARIAATRN